MAKKIYISPSSQTKNEYGTGNTTEAIQCRAIAKLLVTELTRCGIEAKTNVTGDMYARVEESNAFGADLHVCIHTNAYNKKVSGTRIFCYDMSGEGRKACEAIMATLAPITPGTSDGVSARPELYECKATNAPCAYVEVDFHDVDDVALWIIEHKADIAVAIAKGICNYYGVTYRPAEKSPTKGAERINSIGDVPGWAKAETQALIDCGALKGNGEGLDLSEDMLRCIIINKRYADSLMNK